MKLKSPSRFTSFYESFSDLIFATMAIFVLLIVVFLTLIESSSAKNQNNLEHQLSQAQAKLAEQAKELDRAAAERQRAREQLKELTQELANAESAVSARGLELVIAVDVTGSMEEPLGHLLETITTVSRVLPAISPDFKVGVVAYRIGENDSRPLQIFALQQILPESSDRGRSQQRIEAFLRRLEAANGVAPIRAAIDSAVSMFSTPSSYQGSQILLLLGDVGPYELSLNDLFYSDQKKGRFETPLLRQVASWARESERRTVISMFSGLRPAAGLDHRYTIKYEQSLRFFREVATNAGQPENFTQNPGKMLAYLLTAIVRRG